MNSSKSLSSNDAKSTQWLERVVRLLIRNLEYPLHSVSSTSESILKKLMALCSKEQVAIIMGIT